MRIIIADIVTLTAFAAAMAQSSPLHLCDDVCRRAAVLAATMSAVMRHQLSSLVRGRICFELACATDRRICKGRDLRGHYWRARLTPSGTISKDMKGALTRPTGFTGLMTLLTENDPPIRSEH